MGVFQNCVGAAFVVAVLVATLVVMLVLVGCHRMAQYYCAYSAVSFPSVAISDVYPTLKTGDLVMFASSVGSPVNSMLSMTYYSHASIVLREGDQVYLSESQSGTELMPGVRLKHGAVLCPLLPRLKHYTGACYLFRLTRPLSPDQEEKLKKLAERLQTEAYPYPSALQAILGLLGVRSASRHCFQHVAYLLDSVGLTTDRPLLGAGYLGVCREVCELPERARTGGYSPEQKYEPPLQIVYDLCDTCPG